MSELTGYEVVVMEALSAAGNPTPFTHTRIVINALTDAGFTVVSLPADLPQEPRKGREGYHTAQTANQTATAPWPPPAPGTHESDPGVCERWGPILEGYPVDTYEARGGGREFLVAQAWSRANRQEHT